MRVTLNIRKTIEQNAAVYFEKAKKAKKKTDGLRSALQKYEKEIQELQARSEKELSAKAEEEQERQSRKARPRQWYHSFRWFITSDNFLVVGGRDSATNEVVIKKHAEKGDLVLHTDMAGSPFFVIKAGEKKISETAKKEAADATGTFSRAWKLGIARQDVFIAFPEQVIKTGKGGESLPKGAFFINGSVDYVENKLNLAVGIDIDSRIMAGPKEAVSVHCKNFVVLEQGEKKPSDIAKQIRFRLGAGDLDEIVRSLPAGGFKLRESGKGR